MGRYKGRGEGLVVFRIECCALWEGVRWQGGGELKKQALAGREAQTAVKSKQAGLKGGRGRGRGFVVEIEKGWGRWGVGQGKVWNASPLA